MTVNNFGRFVPETRLKQLVRQLAMRERAVIQANMLVRAKDIARHYGLSVCKGELPKNKDGALDETNFKIILNSRVRSVERLKFTFYHEIMHYLIRHDDDLLSLLHDGFGGKDLEKMLERLCQTGAAEFVIPSEAVSNYLDDNEFSVIAIPPLCAEYGASAPSVAFQMTNCAKHDCYMVVCEPDYLDGEDLQPNLLEEKARRHRSLRIVYSAKSFGAKYSIARWTFISHDHLITATYDQKQRIKGKALLPFRSGNVFEVDCDAMFFRDSVYAFFNETSPVPFHQPRLL